jgi:hypothetical protein
MDGRTGGLSLKTILTAVLFLFLGIGIYLRYDYIFPSILVRADQKVITSNAYYPSTNPITNETELTPKAKLTLYTPS